MPYLTIQFKCMYSSAPWFSSHINTTSGTQRRYVWGPTRSLVFHISYKIEHKRISDNKKECKYSYSQYSEIKKLCCHLICRQPKGCINMTFLRWTTTRTLDSQCIQILLAISALSVVINVSFAQSTSTSNVGWMNLCLACGLKSVEEMNSVDTLYWISTIPHAFIIRVKHWTESC